MDEFNRDIATDITEITTRLGEPDAVYQSNPRSMMWRFLIGVILVLAAGILHYFAWTGQIPFAKLRHFKLWIVLFVGMFVGPGAGLYLIFFAVRGLKMWVLEYPMGLFVWHRGVAYALPWDEIAMVRFNGLPSKATFHTTANPDGSIGPGTYDLTRSTARLFGTTLVLTRGDGAEVSISSILTDFPKLGKQIQEQTFASLFPQQWEDFEAGAELAFGAVAISKRHIKHGDDRLAWVDVQSIERESDKLVITTKPKGKNWKKCELDKITNLHLFMALVTHILEQYRETDDEAAT